MDSIFTSQKLKLILRQLITCVGFGLIGLFISSIAVQWFVHELAIFDQTIYPIVGVYAGMFLGICFGGYSFLKKVGRQRECIRFILQGIVGLAIGLAISWKLLIIDELVLPRTFGGVVLISAPIAGLWLGFNYNLVSKRKNGSRYTKDLL